MFDIWLVCILFEKIAQKIPCSAERKTEQQITVEKETSLARQEKTHYKKKSTENGTKIAKNQQHN